MPGPDRVPRFARAFVLALVLALSASALFVWEPWPLTSFRLFSHTRVDEQTAWRVTSVAPDGTERPLVMDALDRGHRNFGFRMAEFVAADEERRDELCRVWVAATNELAGHDAALVRLYEHRWLLSEREGDRAAPGTRRLAFICTPEGVRLAG